MVRQVTIKVTPDMVGLTRVNLSQFSGMDIDVSRSGFPLIEDEDFQNRPEGGFDLIGGAKLVLNERYTVQPAPNQVSQSIASLYPVSQYPHILTLTSIDASVQDSQGNWVSTGVTINQRICRAEPASSGRYLVGPGGDKIPYDFTVYMPLPAETIVPGAKAEITNQDGDMLGTSTVKRFNRGQLNARAWV
jgi:hypothetical protein